MSWRSLLPRPRRVAGRGDLFEQPVDLACLDLGGGPIAEGARDQPAVRSSAATVRRAWLGEQRTVIEQRRRLWRGRAQANRGRRAGRAVGAQHLAARGRARRDATVTPTNSAASCHGRCRAARRRTMPTSELCRRGSADPLIDYQVLAAPSATNQKPGGEGQSDPVACGGCPRAAGPRIVATSTRFGHRQDPLRRVGNRQPSGR